MQYLSKLIFYCFMFCKINSTAQLLSVENCFSGTKEDFIYNTFKLNDNDSIRYMIVGSTSENNFFDSISNSLFPTENIDPFSNYRNTWIVALNENTKTTKRKYIGYYYNKLQVIGNQILFVKYLEPYDPPFVNSLYAFTMDRDLNFTSPNILIDTFTRSENGVYNSFFTKGDSVINLYVYQYRNVPHNQINRYKINNTGILSSTYINSLRYITNSPSSYNLLIQNNKIFEIADSVLKIYNAEAELLGSYQIFNNNESSKRALTKITGLDDSAILLKIYSDSGSLHLVKINKNNSLDYNIRASFPNTQYFYTFEGMVDSNLVVCLNSTIYDSTYFIKFDRTGNVINRYAEKYCFVFSAEDYSDSLRIIIKNTGASMFVQKINKYGIPVSSSQISQTIFAQNTILNYHQYKDFIKTKNGRYFIILEYMNLGSSIYSVLFEYNPLSNGIILQAVLNTACNICNHPEFLDIFSDPKKEVFTLANVNNECVRNADAILYKLANGFNTVRGKIYIDYNNNNNQDNGEPNYENARLSYAKNGITYSNYLIDTGAYSFITDTGRYDITCRITDSLFTITPNNRTISHSTYNNTDFVNFILKPIGEIYDAKILINNTFVTRPGFDGTYALTYSNNGNYPLTNFTVKLLLDSRLNINSSNIPYIISNDTIIWNISNVLHAGEYRTIFINFTAQAPPTLNTNDLLENIVLISIPQRDTDLTNNYYKMEDLVRGSYDPNEKMVDKEQINIADINNKESLLYTIRFENIGNDTAFNISIKDTLANNVIPNTLKPVASSHPYTLTIKNNNILTFYFKNILLPPKSTNAAAANGFVSYEIQPEKNLIINEKIKNTAHILFDYNLPISTNTTTTQIQVVSTAINKLFQDKIFIYPNPAKEQLNIQFKDMLLNNTNLKLTDVSGNIILSQKITAYNIELDVHSLSSGTYFLIFEDKLHVQTTKFIITK